MPKIVVPIRMPSGHITIMLDGMTMLDGVQTRRVVDPTYEEVVGESCPRCEAAAGQPCDGLDASAGEVHSVRTELFEKNEQAAFNKRDRDHMLEMIARARQSGARVLCAGDDPCGICSKCAP